MRARFRSWWQKIRRHWVAIGVGIGLVVIIALIIAEVWFYGTGFDGYNKVTTAHTISGPSTGTVIRTEEYQPAKTLWDWLQLLIIPVVLAIGGYLLNLSLKRNEQEATADNQREAALQEYINKMSELLLEKQLRQSAEDSEVHKIARVRTWNTLYRLNDKIRKRIVIDFLYESGLIEGKCIISLAGANLRGAYLHFAYLPGANLDRVWLNGADLSEARLSGVNLYGAHLDGADLRRADLRGADLTGADLRGAILTNAYLRGAAGITNKGLEKQAKSLKGATMPDGSIHP